QLKDLESQI
nr:Chain B, DxE cargo sorting signal peptide of yeast Sys1 protein [synthetic construct]